MPLFTILRAASLFNGAIYIGNNNLKYLCSNIKKTFLNIMVCTIRNYRKILLRFTVIEYRVAMQAIVATLLQLKHSLQRICIYPGEKMWCTGILNLLYYCIYWRKNIYTYFTFVKKSCETKIDGNLHNHLELSNS